MRSGYTIPDAACEFRYVHARGPGGQHVNKASTAVELRVHLEKLELPPGVLRRLMQQSRNRINHTRELILQADEHRSQQRNKKAALARLEKLIDKAWVAPKKRIPTTPSKAAKKRRLDTKKRRGDVKASRRQPKDF